MMYQMMSVKTKEKSGVAQAKIKFDIYIFFFSRRLNENKEYKGPFTGPGGVNIYSFNKRFDVS